MVIVVHGCGGVGGWVGVVTVVHGRGGSGGWVDGRTGCMGWAGVSGRWPEEARSVNNSGIIIS